ncbi:MAG: TauD/TfdA family dioxygenase [Myxococcaceae bacterium]|nr:TauD/TfdA family dioxygenase [Myxococcaceae bacterium]
MQAEQKAAPGAVRGGDPTWTASALEDEAYRVELTPEESSALQRAVSGTQPWHALRRKDLPPACAPLWQRVTRCLDQTAGFCVVSGLPTDGSDELARRLTFLVGHGLGTPVYQDALGVRMVDIRSTDADANDAVMYKPRADGSHVRPYETRVAFRMHADPCDVAGLFCVQAAAEGGSSSIVNALALHDRIAETRPELLEVLQQPFYYAKPRQPGVPASYHGVPVFSWQDGYFKGHVVPDLIFAAQAVAEVPRLSELQRAALDVLMDLANSAEFRVSLTLRPGQLLLLNNHVVWHGRDAYDDAPGTVRHLLRIWLATPNSRPLHPIHQAWFGSCAAGALRGGYLRDRLGELAD